MGRIHKSTTKSEEEKKLINEKRLSTRKTNMALKKDGKLPPPKKVSVITRTPSRRCKLHPKVLNEYLEGASEVVNDPKPLYTPVYFVGEDMEGDESEVSPLMAEASSYVESDTETATDTEDEAFYEKGAFDPPPVFKPTRGFFKDEKIQFLKAELRESLDKMRLSHYKQANHLLHLQKSMLNSVKSLQEMLKHPLQKY